MAFVLYMRRSTTPVLYSSPVGGVRPGGGFCRPAARTFTQAEGGVSFGNFDLGLGLYDLIHQHLLLLFLLRSGLLLLNLLVRVDQIVNIVDFQNLADFAE